VEHEPWALEPEACPIASEELHDPIDREIREERTGCRQGRQQMAFQQSMERHLAAMAKQAMSFRLKRPFAETVADDGSADKAAVHLSCAFGLNRDPF
jgi:hypothetical protein